MIMQAALINSFETKDGNVIDEKLVDGVILELKGAFPLCNSKKKSESVADIVTAMKDEIIKLQNELNRFAAYRDVLFSDDGTESLTLIRLQQIIAAEKVKAAEQAEDDLLATGCEFGYSDCIHNSKYLEKYHRNYWEEMGCPQSCSCFNGKDYDDEDK